MRGEHGIPARSNRISLPEGVMLSSENQIDFLLKVIDDIYGIEIEDLSDRVVIDGNKVYVEDGVILFVKDVKIDGISVGGWALRKGILYFAYPIEGDGIEIYGVAISGIRRAYILENNGGFGPIVV